MRAPVFFYAHSFRNLNLRIFTRGIRTNTAQKSVISAIVSKNGIIIIKISPLLVEKFYAGPIAARNFNGGPTN